MLANISKVLVVIASPVYKQDQRSNTINILCKEFLDGMQNREVEMDLIDLYQEKFENLIHLPEGDKNETIIDFQERIQEADLVIFFHPIWWGGLPAILQAFIESVLHKGFAYKHYRKFLKPMLTNKKMIVVATGTKSNWIYRLLDRNRLFLFWKRFVEYRTGMKLTNFILFSKIRTVTDEKLEKWKQKIRKLTQTISKPKPQD
jgi:putative NADPH-quinone reductase